MSTAARTRAPGGLSAAELGAWRGLLRAHAALVKALDGELERSHGLALSSFEVLARLDAAPARRMRMCDLASSALLSRSGLTRLVDRLERDGYVARDSCADDARGSFAVLTQSGAQIVSEARATHIEGVRRHFLDRFSARELDGLRGYLERLAEGSPETGCCASAPRALRRLS
jgi:DNA-binding MarR family transcriptional regulator